MWSAELGSSSVCSIYEVTYAVGGALSKMLKSYA